MLQDISTASLKETYTGFRPHLVDALSDGQTCQFLLTQLTSSLMKEKMTFGGASGLSFLEALGLEEEPHLLVPLVSAMSRVEQLQALAEEMSTELRSKQGMHVNNYCVWLTCV